MQCDRLPAAISIADLLSAIKCNACVIGLLTYRANESHRMRALRDLIANRFVACTHATEHYDKANVCGHTDIRSARQRSRMFGDASSKSGANRNVQRATYKAHIYASDDVAPERGIMAQIRSQTLTHTHTHNT